MGRKVFNRRDRSNNEAFKSRLGNNHIVVFRNMLLYMNRIIRLFIDGVTTHKSHRHWVVKRDLGQVKVWVDGPNLLQVVLKLVIIVDGTCIDERLGSPELCHDISFGLLHLLTKG